MVHPRVLKACLSQIFIILNRLNIVLFYCLFPLFVLLSNLNCLYNAADLRKVLGRLMTNLEAAVVIGRINRSEIETINIQTINIISFKCRKHAMKYDIREPSSITSCVWRSGAKKENDDLHNVT